MEWESDARELKAAGVVALGGERVGFLIRGWEIESRKRSILSSSFLKSGKRSIRLPSCRRWFSGRVVWFLSIRAAALNFILMHLMLYADGSRKECLQLKFQRLLNGNFESIQMIR